MAETNKSILEVEFHDEMTRVQVLQADTGDMDICLYSQRDTVPKLVR